MPTISSSATVSAAFGGTTTVIPFAAQHVGNKLRDVVAAYHALATKGSVIDYAFHMIIADPTEETVTSDIPAMVEQGMGSIKIFMTYDRLKVEDEKLLDVLPRRTAIGRDGVRARREPRHALLDGAARWSRKATSRRNTTRWRIRGSPRPRRSRG